MSADAQLSYGAACFTKILHLLFILATQIQSVGSVMKCLNHFHYCFSFHALYTGMPAVRIVHTPLILCIQQHSC